MIKLVDQIRLWKKDKKDDSFRWDEFEIKAAQFDREIELEFRKYEMAYQNSPIAIAERIADIKTTIDECEECSRLKKEGVASAVARYERIGSIKEQIQRGERIINQNPGRELQEIADGIIIYTCSQHKRDFNILKELYKIQK